MSVSSKNFKIFAQFLNSVFNSYKDVYESWLRPIPNLSGKPRKSFNQILYHDDIYLYKVYILMIYVYIKCRLGFKNYIFRSFIFSQHIVWIHRCFCQKRFCTFCVPVPIISNLSPHFIFNKNLTIMRTPCSFIQCQAVQRIPQKETHF